MSGIVVLFGGSSSERRVSCASAQHFSEVLLQASCWFWQEDGAVVAVDSAEIQNHQNVFLQSFNPKKVLTRWDSMDQCLDYAKGKGLVIVNSLHGGDGENGWIQRACERRQLAYTGSGAEASALALDKPLAKQKVRSRGVLVADQLVFSGINQSSKADLIAFQAQHGRIVLKPANEGSSAGLSFVETKLEVESWINAREASAATWLCEEMLIGREFTIGVVMFRGCLMALPPSEVILERNARFDYEGKYLGVGNREITPADLSPKDAALVQETVLLAHTSLGCYGYTRSEVIFTKRGPVFLETNTLPGLTKRSFIPQQLAAAKINVLDFVNGQIELANRRYE
ncbi:MAG: D-alanine--D-alanine ligase [Proteobacteria bacterium]|nr:D-alanine--D-alanine ligase [Pseudomonadota bacterium]